MKFEKAVKSKARLRLALFGPAGSGKTFSALRIAAGLGGNVAVIDTERGSASKYADRFTFDVLELEDPDIDSMVSAIHAADTYQVLVIDSLTHSWHELLAEVENIAKAKYKGNTWSAWSEGTPKQRSLVDALLKFDGHVIATMRVKTEWTQEKDERTGKVRPVRVGLSPEQGKGIEYEFDMLMEISPEHVATVIKDRTGRYQDKYIDKPGEDLGRELVEWLSSGADALPAEKPPQKFSVPLKAEPAFEKPAGLDPAEREALAGDIKEAIEDNDQTVTTMVQWLKDKHGAPNGINRATVWTWLAMHCPTEALLAIHRSKCEKVDANANA